METMKPLFVSKEIPGMPTAYLRFGKQIESPEKIPAMPELPDVETFKRYIDSTSLHKKIRRVEIKDKQTLNNAAQTIKRRIESQAFESTERHGKYLLISAGSDTWLAVHFGMTGTVKYQQKENGYPDHCRVAFHFQDDGYLAYICQRKLGSIEVIDDPAKFKEENELGKDALAIDLEEFRSLLSDKRGMIKSALMDQSTIAGIGNVYSDEILYQCKIHPKTKIKELDDSQIKELHGRMKRILETAINNQANPQDMPSHYLITHRSEGGNCPDCGGKVKRIEVSGRGCYICAECQKQ